MAKNQPTQDGPGIQDYFRLIRLIIDPDGIVATALCRSTPTTEADFTSKVLLKIFHSCGMTNNLVDIVIQDELSKTVRAGTLFRGNSLASKVMTGYSRLVGKEYLTKTLSPILQKMFATSTTSYEISPAKLKDSDNLEENKKKLLELCQNTFQSILSSVSYLPHELKAVCHFLYTASNEKFPGSCYFAVGGFFFLRFLGPVIVSPDAFGVTTERILPPIRRGLVLVSKTLQTLSNGVEFGKKEEFMMCMNPFIQSQKDKFNQFIDGISAKPAQKSTKGFEAVSFDPTAMDTTQLGKLAKILRNNYKKVSIEISSMAQQLGSSATKQKNTTLLQEFDSVLSELVPPLSDPNAASSSSSSSSSSSASSSLPPARKLMKSDLNANVLEPTLQKKIETGPKTFQ